MSDMKENLELLSRSLYRLPVAELTDEQLHAVVARAVLARLFNKMCFYKTVNILTVIKLKSSVVKINSNAFKPFNNIIHFISSNNSLFAKHFNMC